MDVFIKGFKSLATMIGSFVLIMIFIMGMAILSIVVYDKIYTIREDRRREKERKALMKKGE